jgi:intein/homing endonuclease
VKEKEERLTLPHFAVSQSKRIKENEEEGYSSGDPWGAQAFDRRELRNLLSFSKSFFKGLLSSLSHLPRVVGSIPKSSANFFWVRPNILRTFFICSPRFFALTSSDAYKRKDLKSDEQ